MADDEKLYERGLAVRRQVMSDPFVDLALSRATDFSAPIQRLATTAAWGSLWTREGLSRRDRSLVTITALASINRNTELADHVRGAIRNGVTVEEIREVFVHLSGYCGMPCALESTRVAERVINDMKEAGEI